MPRKTQNAIQNADGSAFQLTNDPQSFVSFLQLFNALRFKQGTDKDGNLLWEDAEGKPTTENTGTPYIPAKPRSGYASYATKRGFADPVSPEKFDAQGIGMYLAKLFECSQMIILKGGKEAQEMQAILDGAFGYFKVAGTLLAEQKSQEAVKLALNALGQVNNGNTAAAQKQLINMLEASGVPTPNATAENTAAPTETEVTQTVDNAEVKTEEVVNA